MKRLWTNIRLFFISLAWGMRGADKIISTSNKEADGSDLAGVEQHKETESVYADLLRGEVTQEVKELRHEMYYAERKSHEYDYGGNGRAIKRNDIFDYNGNIEKSDGFKIEIVQDNKEDPSSLMECGIFCNGEKVDLSEEAIRDLRVKDKRDFTIVIGRDFMPSFRLEQYATKLVVKRIDKEHVLLDIYVPKYTKQFDNSSKLFVSAIEKIYMGDKRSGIIDFDTLEFTSYNAYGTDDLKQYKYKNISFDNIIEFDGSYVLRFVAEVEVDGYDIISEFYDEIAAEKSKNHEMRKGAVLDIANVIEAKVEDEYDVEQAKKLVEELKNEE